MYSWPRHTLTGCTLAFLVSAFALAQAPQTIHLTVDYADGVQKTFVLPFKPDMSVYDAMVAAQANPHGLAFACDPRFPCDGPIDNRLLVRIDDLAAQGAATASHSNWHLWVNGIYANRGFAVCRIGPDDRVLWRFDAYHGEQPGKACR